MINDATLDELYHVLLNVLDKPEDREKLEDLINKLDDLKIEDRDKAIELMRTTLVMLKADTSVVYVVAQQTPHGASMSSGEFYTDYKLADKAVAYYHREKMNWMKRFRLDIVRELPEYMKPK
jgi:S-methylmethionine-dependent homocysteine/selenocysteine methylase